jgi:AbrB family looped-hinge helix DNA binding protein
MVITSKGQITIPRNMRRQLGLFPGTRVAFEVEGDSVRVRKADRQTRGHDLVAHMMAVARRAPGPRLTTDQILAFTRGR